MGLTRGPLGTPALCFPSTHRRSFRPPRVSPLLGEPRQRAASRRWPRNRRDVIVLCGEVRALLATLEYGMKSQSFRDFRSCTFG